MHVPEPAHHAAKALCDAVDQHFDASQVPQLKALVDIPSHTYAPDDVETMARAVDELAVAQGLSVRRFEADDDRFADHRVYVTPAAADGAPAVALVGHFDTVFAKSTGFLTFARDGDVARGPGVLDMKSGLTCIFFALRALRDAAPELWSKLRVRVVCVTDEEVGTPSGRKVYDALAPSLTEALVFEMGRAGDRIITSRKGGGTFVLEAHGTAAHAGNEHDRGISAVHALARVIPRLEALTDYEKGVTVNVGLLEGGTSKNTVPGHARCVIDLRAITPDDATATASAIVRLAEHPFDGLADVPDKLRAVRFEVSGSVNRPPMEATPAIQDLRRRYERHARAVGFGAGEAPRQGGFSDANLLGALGVPTIDGLGASGGGAHSTDEWCSLDSVRRRTQALALFLAEIAAEH